MAMYQQLTEHSHAMMKGRQPLAPYFPPVLTEALMILFSVARTVGAPPWMAGTCSGPKDPDGPVLVYPPAHKESVLSICREAGQVLKRSRTAQRTVAILPQWDGQPLGHWVHSTGGKVALKIPKHRVPYVGYKQILGQAPISRLRQFCSPVPMWVVIWETHAARRQWPVGPCGIQATFASCDRVLRKGGDGITIHYNHSSHMRPAPQPTTTQFVNLWPLPGEQTATIFHGSVKARALYSRGLVPKEVRRKLLRLPGMCSKERLGIATSIALWTIRSLHHIYCSMLSGFTTWAQEQGVALRPMPTADRSEVFTRPVAALERRRCLQWLWKRLAGGARKRGLWAEERVRFLVAGPFGGTRKIGTRRVCANEARALLMDTGQYSPPVRRRSRRRRPKAERRTRATRRKARTGEQAVAVAPVLTYAASPLPPRTQVLTAAHSRPPVPSRGTRLRVQAKRQRPNKCKKCGGVDHVRCVPGLCPAHPDYQPRPTPIPSRKRRAAAVCRACGQSDHVRSVRHRCPMYGTSGPPSLRQAGGASALPLLLLQAENKPTLAPSSLDRWLLRPQLHASAQDQEARTTVPEKRHSV